MTLHRRTFLLSCSALLLPFPLAAEEAQPEAIQDAQPAAPSPVIVSNGIAMHGDPKYPPGFPHFDYVDPAAPKGGRMIAPSIGSYDSFNNFIAKGDPAPGLGLVSETLMTGSEDEAFSQYGLLAESIEYPEDRSWVTFHLHPEARWHDGQPITADDVVWTFESLMQKGTPMLRFYYSSVEKVEKLDDLTVRFVFQPGENRELPLILGQLTVLPKHWWTAEGREIGNTTLEPPLGSGPYRLARFEAGRFVEYKRVEDWWGKDLAVNVGRYNFDVLRYDCYLEPIVARQALKAGALDYYLENQAKAWATDYDVPQVRDGRLLMEQFENKSSGGMQNFTMNTRRAVFSDSRVRLAVTQAFDFEWTNRNLFFGLYVRPNSYFFPTELGARGLPTPEELAILEPFRSQLPDEVFTQVYAPPTTDGSGWPRENLTKAFALLAEAGWTVRDLKLVNAAGEQFRFEILLVSQQFERLVLPYMHNLRRLGMDVRLRTVDQSQYINRLRVFDFDMIVGGIGQSLSPGNEQRSYWTSEAADQEGGYNYAGIKDPVVDALVEQVVAAPDRESLIYRTRALDRVLLWGYYGVPQWSSPFTRLVAWDKFGRPPVVPLQGLSFDSWWYDANKAAILDGRGGQDGQPES